MQHANAMSWRKLIYCLCYFFYITDHENQIFQDWQVLNDDKDDDVTSLICSINDIDDKVQIVDLLQHLLKKYHMIMNFHITHDSRLQINESCFHALHDEVDDEVLDENINHDEICS